MRSRLTLRSSVSFGAAGEGFRCSFSRRARMNASIGFRTHAASSVVGGATRLTGWKAHQSAPFGFDAADRVFGPRHALLNPAPDAGDLVRLEFPPRRHFQFAGLLDCAHQQALRRASGLDGTTPRLPPARMASREVSASPLDLFVSLWHGWQFAFRICWIAGWLGWRGRLRQPGGRTHQYGDDQRKADFDGLYPRNTHYQIRQACVTASFSRSRPDRIRSAQRTRLELEAGDQLAVAGKRVSAANGVDKPETARQVPISGACHAGI